MSDALSACREDRVYEVIFYLDNMYSLEKDPSKQISNNKLLETLLSDPTDKKNHDEVIRRMTRNETSYLLKEYSSESDEYQEVFSIMKGLNYKTIRSIFENGKVPKVLSQFPPNLIYACAKGLSEYKLEGEKNEFKAKALIEFISKERGIVGSDKLFRYLVTLTAIELIDIISDETSLWMENTLKFIEETFGDNRLNINKEAKRILIVRAEKRK